MTAGSLSGSGIIKLSDISKLHNYLNKMKYYVIFLLKIMTIPFRIKLIQKSEHKFMSL